MTVSAENRIAPEELRLIDYHHVALDLIFGPATADLMCLTGLWTFGDLLAWLRTPVAPVAGHPDGLDGPYHRMRDLVPKDHAEPEVLRWFLDLNEAVIRRTFAR